MSTTGSEPENERLAAYHSRPTSQGKLSAELTRDLHICVFCPHSLNINIDACIFVCNPSSRTPHTVRLDHLISNLIYDGTTYGIVEVNNDPCASGLYNQNGTEQRTNKTKNSTRAGL